MKIIMTDGTDERFILLCRKLDEYLNDIVGGEKQRIEYMQYNTLEDIHDVILIEEEGNIVGCGSLKEYTNEAAELKRIFVCEECRGKKYGMAIVKQLEKSAKQQGYKRLVLETGRPLKRAMKLYEGLGYQITENYGPYIDMADSICMEKIL